MNSMETRLRRLEGPYVADGETPGWSVTCARQEADLGFVDSDAVDSRAREIAVRFGNHAAYTQRQQEAHHSFIAEGERK